MTRSAKWQFAKDKTVFRCMIRPTAQIANKALKFRITIPKNLLFSWLVKKFRVIYAYWSLITVFTRVHDQLLSWIMQIHCIQYIYILRVNSLCIIRQSTPGLSKWFFPFIYFEQNVYVSLHPPSAGMPKLKKGWTICGSIVLPTSWRVT